MPKCQRANGWICSIHVANPTHAPTERCELPANAVHLCRGLPQLLGNLLHNVILQQVWCRVAQWTESHRVHTLQTVRVAVMCHFFENSCLYAAALQSSTTSWATGYSHIDCSNHRRTTSEMPESTFRRLYCLHTFCCHVCCWCECAKSSRV